MMSTKFLDRRDGGEAEQVFRDYANAHEIQWTNYGFHRPPIDNFYGVHPFVSHTPDFLAYWNKKHVLVETKGTGRDGILKVKLKDMNQFFIWNGFQPIYFFVWNSSTRKISVIQYEDFDGLCVLCDVKKFEEGNEYYAVPHHLLVWEELDHDYAL